MSENKFVTPTSLPGLFLVNRPTFADDRGFFREIFHLDEIQSATGVDFHPVQWNHSCSRPRVIRALHAENWNKLIYPVTGTMFSAIADIRPDSPTFAKIFTFTFNPNDHAALFISAGLANSICVVGNEIVHYMYLVDKYYDGKDTTAVAWDDPDLNISWPITDPIISDRDKHNPKLKELISSWPIKS